MRPSGVVSLWLHWLTAGCITALFGLVLYVLAYLDSWILYEDWWELVALLAMQLLLALAIAVVAASLGFVFSLPVALWRNRRGKSEDAGQLADFTAATACGSLLLQARNVHGINQLQIRVRRHRFLAHHDLADHRVGREVQCEIFLVHARRGVGPESRIQGGIVDALRMQLVFDPGIESFGDDGSNLARSCPESQTVDGLKDTLVFV